VPVKWLDAKKEYKTPLYTQYDMLRMVSTHMTSTIGDLAPR